MPEENRHITSSIFNTCLAVPQPTEHASSQQAGLSRTPHSTHFLPPPTLNEMETAPSVSLSQGTDETQLCSFFQWLDARTGGQQVP